MVNTFKTATAPASQALAILENTKVFSALVNTGYVSEHGKKFNGYERGNVIPLMVPARFAAEIWDGSSAAAQDATESVINITISDLIQVPMNVTVSDMTFMLETFSSGGGFSPDFMKRVLVPAFEALSNFEDAYIAKKAAQATPYYHGTAGTTPSALSDITGVRKELNVNKCPSANRRLVLNPDADEKMLQLSDFVNVNKSNTSLALVEAQLGRKYGFDVYMDQNIYDHTAGTLAATTAISVKGAVALGATSMTLDDATGLTGTLVVGDILSITDATTSKVTTVVVTALATAAANEIAVSVVASDIAIADNSVVTVIGSHAANLAFQKDGIFHVSVPSAVAPGDGFVIQNPYTGMGATIRIQGATIAGKSNSICIEAYIATAVRKECVTRLLG